MAENTASIAGYIDYQRREYCKAVQCPVQLDLNQLGPGSGPYENLRATCKNACRHTTHDFHAWLIEQGYLIVRPGK